MAYTSEATRARAEAHFKAKERQKADAPQAMQEYRAQQTAMIERMRRLRAARLAREAEDQKQ